ncbi:heat-shock protein Hsp20 [Bacillus sp. MUM 116]|nr:heat-shock protein Hsp20 [Bacillus sp. MUM 116]
MSSMLPSDSNNKKKSKTEPFSDLFKSVNDLFHEQPIRGFLQSIDELFKTPFPYSSAFPVETVETNGEYIITAELPGVKKEQIQLNISGHYVTISIENNEMITKEDEKNQLYSKRQLRQHSSRTISLPYPVNEKKVKASYRDGLLQIRIPQEKGKVIRIDE